METNRKKVLLINPFDKIPGENFRDQRYTHLFYNLMEKEVDVTWISSSFHHWSHTERLEENIPIQYRKNIVLIKTNSYKNNISLLRFYNHFIFSLKTFMYLFRSKKQYDVIVAIAPVENIFLSTLYAKLKSTKVIIDILDLWPELFEQAFPSSLKGIGRLLLKPYYWMSNYAYRNADHLTSVSKTYTNIGINRSNRLKSKDSYFYLGSPTCEMPVRVKKSLTQLNCLFAGQFGHNYDVELILEAALKAKKNNENIYFYIAGSGMKEEQMKMFINLHELDNVEMLGWLNTKELIEVANKCHVGLNSYKALATQSLPTKIFDYLSLELVLLNSLAKEPYELVIDKDLGENYEAENLDSFYEQLLLLKSKINDLEYHGVKNKKVFLENYTFEKIYDRMVNLILNI